MYRTYLFFISYILICDLLLLAQFIAKQSFDQLKLIWGPEQQQLAVNIAEALP